MIAKVALSLRWLDPSWIEPLFWALPAAIIFANQLICYYLDTTFLGQRWTTLDVLELACWRTVSPFVALLFVATAFDAVYDKSWTAILWLIGAAILDFAGTIKLRLAEGLKLKKIKSGELYKRAFVMAKEMGTTLKRVYVVPAGRGHLTNAFGLGYSIAVTDNYGKFLSRSQLDFVIGHELAHVKGRHGRRNIRATAGVYAVTALVFLFLPQAFIPFRPLLDVLVIFGPILVFYFLSRRFEYAADRISIEFTRDPETAIQALTNLYKINEAPTHCGRLTELFMTHPALTRRIAAIGQAGLLPSERVSELVREMSADKITRPE